MTHHLVIMSHCGAISDREERPASRGRRMLVVAQRQNPIRPYNRGMARSITAATQYVGRQRELSTLVECLEQARAGAGDVVVIRGEAGLGKSRLCQELLEIGARHGAVGLTGHCLRGGGIPYLPFAEVLECALEAFGDGDVREAAGASGADLVSIAPALRDALGPSTATRPVSAGLERHALFAALRDFLSRLSKISPLLVVIEDAHWADDATAQLLRYLARAVKTRSILIIVTCRTSDDGLHETAQLQAELERQSASEPLVLDELSAPEVAALIADLVGREPPDYVASALYERVGGSPLFVEQVVKHLVEDSKLFDERGRWIELTAFDAVPLPASLRAAIEQRLDRLSVDARQVLAVAAVAGRRADYDLDWRGQRAGTTRARRCARAGGARPAHHDVAWGLGSSGGVRARLDPADHPRTGVPCATTGASPGARTRARTEKSGCRRVRTGARVPLHRVALPAAWPTGAPASPRRSAASRCCHGVRGCGSAVRRRPGICPGIRSATRCEMLLLLGEARKRVSDSDFARAAFEEAARIAEELDAGGLYARAALGYSSSWPTVGSVDERAVELLRQRTRHGDGRGARPSSAAHGTLCVADALQR